MHFGILLLCFCSYCDYFNIALLQLNLASVVKFRFTEILLGAKVYIVTTNEISHMFQFTVISTPTEVCSSPKQTLHSSR